MWDVFGLASRSLLSTACLRGWRLLRRGKGPNLLPWQRPEKSRILSCEIPLIPTVFARGTQEILQWRLPIFYIKACFSRWYFPDSTFHHWRDRTEFTYQHERWAPPHYIGKSSYRLSSTTSLSTMKQGESFEAEPSMESNAHWWTSPVGIPSRSQNTPTLDALNPPWSGVRMRYRYPSELTKYHRELIHPW